MPGGRAVLIEGGAYQGCWLESTGTIGAQTLSRFCPGLAESTFLSFAENISADGLIPYKLIASGPAYRQVQMVTPLARAAWEHYKMNGGGLPFLERMYGAMSANDAWLAAKRDTRGSGCVEAFCAFDAGHDLSPRFWHVPDTCHEEDPARFDPDSPTLPFLAPDLTANVACQRSYLARMARELGLPEAGAWEAKAAASLGSLMRECYDPEDGFFYDRDRAGRFVRVQTDVLLRVLACEVGDGEFFARGLERYLLDSRKFFSKYPLASVAMDDPRFDPHSHYNSWAGPPNFLSLLRAPAAFELHGRLAELGWIMDPALKALGKFARFAQTMSPWTGEEGYTEGYTPTILCLLDYVERSRGILPRPDGRIALSAYSTAPSAYSRNVDGRLMELEIGDGGATAYADGEAFLSFPPKMRAILSRSGELKKIIGLSPRRIEGKVEYRGREFAIAASGNQSLRFDEKGFVDEGGPGIVLPS
jgi:hypothetical protein